MFIQECCIIGMVSPALYLGHGSPTNALDKGKYSKQLLSFGKSTEVPQAIIALSAHWERHIPMFVTSGYDPGIIYDFYGFPDVLYNIKYEYRGDPRLAKLVAQELTTNGFETHLNSTRGIDHGVWVPLMKMYPEADVPIIQLSIPLPNTPNELFKIGELLSKFRYDDVMLVGSGNLVHNIPHALTQIQMGKTSLDFTSKNEEWAVESDRWIKEKLESRKVTELLDSPHKLPHYKMAAPTSEHYDPLYFVLGATKDNEEYKQIFEGFQARSFSMRCFATES